ncbi:MAG: DNA polymerase Y family protein [Burkholderiales bacterium]
MLWIALHLPWLSLETFAATLPPELSESALALVDEHHIVNANAAARALDVKPGLKRATALAIAPQITLGQADPRRDAQALLAVAHAALAFTPTVVIEPATADATPHTVLLEVHASLRYFGGLPALRQRLQAALAPLGHRLHIVSAATPLGAALLARAHRALDCIELPATCRALASAPVWLLGPGRAHWEALQGMGLRTLADLGRVPRAGLARRFGEAVLNDLDRAMGTRPDPREPIVPAPRFDTRLELFARADTGEQLLHGAAALLARLIAWLSAQHAFVRRFTLVMHHEQRSRRDASTPATTALDIALAEPSRDSAHLLMLLRERLAHLQLPAPTLELGLHAEDIARRAPPNAELFPTPASEHEGLTRLIERLQARLGPEQVTRIAPAQDHRPERATISRVADAQMRPSRTRAATDPGVELRVRPVWLMQQPEPLQQRDAAPVLDGKPLHLLSGPERIETGWWDAGLVERDYYIAQQPGGALVWVYRLRRPVAPPAPSWFLQGRFG